MIFNASTVYTLNLLMKIDHSELLSSPIVRKSINNPKNKPYYTNKGILSKNNSLLYNKKLKL